MNRHGILLQAARPARGSGRWPTASRGTRTELLTERSPLHLDEAIRRLSPGPACPISRVCSARRCVATSGGRHREEPPWPRPLHPDTGTPPVVHLYVLLDRSGSMASIADDVIGANSLLVDQQAEGADARVTLVQFDGQNPHEVVEDAVPISSAATRRDLRPQGATPLLDAHRPLLTRASQREVTFAALGEPAEEIIVVSITDGHENASEELDLATVRAQAGRPTQSVLC